MTTSFTPIVIEEKTPQACYEQAKSLLKSQTSIVNVRGRDMKELLNVELVAEEQGYIKARSVDENYIFQEIANIWEGRDCDLDHPDFVEDYLNPDTSLDQNVFWGPKVRNALYKENFMRMVEFLDKKPFTRRCLFDLSDKKFKEGKDVNEIPCLVSAHFLFRDNKLHFQVNARSADINMGVPYDFYLFQHYQRLAARELELETGKFLYKANSFHKYVDHGH